MTSPACKFITLVIVFHLLGLINPAYSQMGVYMSAADFTTKVRAMYPDCVYPDGSLNTACLATKDSLDLNGGEIENYESLNYFPLLRYLDISNNPNSSFFPNFGFPTTPFPYLKVFKCRNMSGFSVPYFDNLEYLDYANSGSNPSQTVAPVFPPGLKYLDCSQNSIFGNLTLPPLLDTLICKDNGYYFSIGGGYTGISSFSSLPATLKYFDCSGNVLTSLPPLPASLTYLNCSKNIQSISSGPSFETVGGIAALPASLPPNLKTLDCSQNYITSIPNLPNTLEYLDCGANALQVLPPLPSNLRVLRIRNIQVPSIPALPDSLRQLFCSANGNLRCLPHLPPFLNTLETYSTNINCLPNTVPALVTSTITTLCTPTNNSNLCVASAVISGYVFYDNNSNGVKETGENYRANVAIQLDNGLQTFSNSDGFYNITADTGLNVLTVVTPNYYNVVPAAVNITVPSFSSVMTHNVALRPTVNVDSVSITVTPATFARPGFEQWYDIAYENVGTTTVSPSSVFNYDNTRLTFISASNPAVVNNGSALTLNQPNLTPGQRGSYSALFTVNVSAVPGDTIFVNVDANAGSSSVTDSSYTVITASFDPNDKAATPKLTPAQVSVGTYIDYLVRFQNTGTDTAFNIVITDVLDAKLDASSFQMINTSHPCRVTREGGNLTLEFLNILLPNLGINEPGSHGYFRFRVRPQQSVVVNDVIPNRVSIYFDFNAPVLTDIANTYIELAVVPLRMVSFKGFVSTHNEALLTWNTENEINTRSFEVQESIDGEIFRPIGTVAALGQTTNSYNFKTLLYANTVYYRLKMIDSDDRFVYSEVIVLKKTQDESGITVLSNPVRSTLSIVVLDPLLVNTTAALINEQGIVLKSFQLAEGSQKIDVSKLRSGNYFLKTKFITKKIVVVN